MKKFAGASDIKNQTAACAYGFNAASGHFFSLACCVASAALVLGMLRIVSLFKKETLAE